MVSLATFARRMVQLGKRVEKRSNLAVIRTATVVNQAVVLATPVDKGQARGGWQAGIASPPPGTDGALDKEGSATIAQNNATIKRRRRGQDVFISNNVGHIGPLNAGSSSQAPANFIEKAVAEGVAAVRNFKVLGRG